MILSNDKGKKMLEQMDFQHFIEAYEYALGEKLIPLYPSEAPDFICKKENGLLIGAEMTKIVRDPDTKFIDSLNYKEYMDGSETSHEIYNALERKKGLGSEKIILIMQLIDCLLSDLAYYLKGSLQDDFASYGFAEIWLADYTGLEAYGDIELFCLHPADKWRYYQRPNPWRKPYG